MKTLELKFTNDEGRVVTLSLDDPVEPVNPEAVRQVMEQIIDLNAFTSSGGDLVAKHSARIVERHVDDIVW
ncbi:DUF2922 domain-containing protein [Amphibacillus indicireducens]|uniref:DUF2922 domain-containing protein n=1 Tax=Amphibacillus indicireducens TaxID=1076330 RepID=A0ABP7VNU1_9BACI